MSWNERVTWPRTTERLSIRPTTPDDFAALWAIRRLESVTRWMTHRADDLTLFTEQMSDPARLGDTLTVELDGTLVGDLMIRVEDPWSQGEVAELAKGTLAEIGWCLDPEVHGHGYGTEAAAELLRICFEDLGLRRVVALCFAENLASARVMERLGMRREAHNIADCLHRDGTWRDGFTYALLADEWAGNQPEISL